MRERESVGLENNTTKAVGNEKTKVPRKASHWGEGEGTTRNIKSTVKMYIISGGGGSDNQQQ